ncbi:unnamed protein product [Polarella glacialis]|uniref:Uncharacterized protein n=1 Tax=Polarella glacialis TaxID=89957 RepID=A0A813JNV7_POLGL|nr:unnamed protein product [Polarella glacialis]
MVAGQSCSNSDPGRRAFESWRAFCAGAHQVRQELRDARTSSAAEQTELWTAASEPGFREASLVEFEDIKIRPRHLWEDCAELLAGRGVALDQAREAEAARDSLELRLARLQADMTSQEASLTAKRQLFLETERLDGDGLLESQAKTLSEATQELSDVRAASSRLQSELLQSESVLRSCEASSAESGKLASTAAMVLEHDACTQRLREECAELLGGRGVALDQARQAEAARDSLELRLARLQADMTSQGASLTAERQLFLETEQLDGDGLLESQAKILIEATQELSDVRAVSSRLQSELLQSESVLRSCEASSAESGNLASTAAMVLEHDACTQRLREECAELLGGRGVALDQARQAEAARDSLELRLARLQADMTSQEASFTERQAFLETERLDGDGLLESQAKILSAATQELSDVRAASSRLQSELLRSESVLRSCEASSAESGKLASTAAAEHDACTQRLQEECAELIAGRGVALDRARQAEAARDSLELWLARLQADMTSQEASFTERQAFLETERLDGDGLLESQAKILSAATQELSDVRAASSRLQSELLRSESVLRSCEASSAESGKLASTAAAEHDACTQRLREECAELIAGRGVALDQAREAEATINNLELQLARIEAEFESRRFASVDRDMNVSEAAQRNKKKLHESNEKALSDMAKELCDVWAENDKLKSELIESESALRSCEVNATARNREHDACTHRLQQECAELLAGRGVALDQAREAEAARDSLELRLARLQADMTSQGVSLTETERLDGDGLLESQAKILSEATHELSDVRAASSRLQSELLQSESVLRSCEASSAESGKLASTAAMVLEHDACTQRLREECAELLGGRGVALDQARQAEAARDSLELRLARLQADMTSQEASFTERHAFLETERLDGDGLLESQAKILSEATQELSDVRAASSRLQSEVLQSESVLRSCEASSSESGNLASTAAAEHDACTQRLREECAESIAGRGVALDRARQAEAARDSLELRLARLQADMTSQEASFTERQAFLETERLDGDELLESQAKILIEATHELSDVRAASSRLQSEVLQSESVLRSCEASSAESGKLASTAAMVLEHDACTQRLREECAELLGGRGVALDQARQAEAARDSLELRLGKLQAHQNYGLEEVLSRRRLEAALSSLDASRPRVGAAARGRSISQVIAEMVSSSGTQFLSLKGQG